MPAPETLAFADISGLLYPASIAVVGASDRSGNLGGETIAHLLRFGFPGPVYAVNPAGGSARGLPCYRSLAALPAPPESVIMAVPGPAVLDTVRDCAAQGIKNGVAFAGGFAEAGHDGADLQRRLAQMCLDADFKLCGPNCMGIINAATPVTSTFATSLQEMQSLRAGPVSVVTQSGGIGGMVFFAMQRAGFGGRHLISGGNEAVVSIADYIYGLACDDGTQVIAVYLESVRDGAKLIRALEEARRREKPVVLIKSGVTGAAAVAAQAHTGALVGEDRVFDAILQELSVIRVRSVEEMIDVCSVLSGTPRAKLPAGNGIGIATFGGGSGVLAADQCAQYGLTVPPLGAAAAERIRPLLVSVASAANPMDLTPTTALRAENLTKLPAALDILAAQPDIHALILIAGSMPGRKKEISDTFVDFQKSCPKLVCVSWPLPPQGTVEGFVEHGIVSFDEPARGLRALGHLAAYGAARARPQRSEIPAPLAFDWAAHVPAGATVLPEDRCHAILREAGLAAAAGRLAASEADAIGIAREIGLPVVMKGITPKITHRAAAGLLAVDLRSAADVGEAFRRLEGRARDLGVALDGVYVQKMARGGVELLVSVFRDPVFGTMISCGSGGVMTEQFDDVVTSRAPVNAAIASAMLGRTRLWRQARDEQGPLDVSAPADFIARLSQLGAAAPWRRFTFEINPVKWTRAGVVAVDGLLVLDPP